MRKRNIQINTRLDKTEHERFKKRVKKSGLSQEAYVRHLINGLVPNDAPPPDYFSMMRELYGIGSRMNQIAIKAHSLNAIDAKRYDENYRQLVKTLDKITDAVILPKEMGSPQSLLCGEKEQPRSDEPFDACDESGKRRAL